MPNLEVILRTGMMSVVTMPTRGDNILDRIYTSVLKFDNIKMIKSSQKRPQGNSSLFWCSQINESKT